MAKRSCCHCKRTDRELRPYGPGGADICFPCMKEDPAREKTAKAELGKAFEAAGPVAVLTPRGPKPFKGRR